MFCWKNIQILMLWDFLRIERTTFVEILNDKKSYFPMSFLQRTGLCPYHPYIFNDTAMMVPRNKKKQFEIVRKLRTIFRLFRNLRNI